MSHVSVRELKRICRKGERDPFWISNFFWRPFSIYGTWLAVALGMRPNAITAMSAVCALASSFLLLVPSSATYVWSVILMQAFFYLDHVDGELARYHRSIGSIKPENLSGGYFDRLVHYYQGPSFFFCLGAGLAWASGQMLWLVVAVIGGLGSSGFPRFVAVYEIVLLILRRQDKAAMGFAANESSYYSAYWNPGEEPVALAIPHNWREFVFWAKQLIWFPGHLFVFAATVLVTVATGMNLIWMKAFLSTYTIILGGNLLYTTFRYLRTLADVPAPDD